MSIKLLAAYDPPQLGDTSWQTRSVKASHLRGTDWDFRHENEASGSWIPHGRVDDGRELGLDAPGIGRDSEAQAAS